MRSKTENQLILGRFQKQFLLKKTQNKEIWILQNTISSQRLVGKFQSKAKLDKSTVKNVLHEASFLQQMQGHTGIPLMYWSGVEGIQIVVIFQYLGYTLSQRLKQCDGKFSTKTVCMLGITILNILRNLHEKGIIHRNLSPSSIQFGRGMKSSQIYLNDLVDAKKYRNKKTYAHIPFKKGIKYSFENKFGSQRFHKNQETSRIDDIENLIKVLIYFVTGSQPSKKGQFKEKQIPSFLKEMLEHCHSYQFADDPVYDWFTQKLASVIFHNSQQNDGVFDWMISKNRAKLLRVDKHLVSLKLQEDKQILAQFYDPYQQAINIDEITQKHHRQYGINQHQSTPVMNNVNSIQIEQKLRKRKSIKRDKPDCRIM